jgi:putative ABC transport system substrate-binding protein
VKAFSSKRVSDSCSDKRPRGLKSKIQNPEWAGLVAFVVALAICGAVAQAQQPAGIPRIGILITPSASSYSARLEAFRRRLRELGYVEGKNLVIEYRYAEGKRERLPDLAAELVRLKVDVIVTTGVQPVLAAKKASATIPIVFAASSDPVGAGLVSSLARPSGNITGLSLMAPDLGGKRLELLKQVFPKIARVAFLWQSSGTRGDQELTEMEAAAKALGLKLRSLPVRGLEDFEGAFDCRRSITRVSLSRPAA